MNQEQRATLERLTKAALPTADNEEGSERQIEAGNEFHEYVSATLGIDTEDMQTAKASQEEMIHEALRRAEEKHLCDELQEYCATHKLKHQSADELLAELYATDEPDNHGHCKWLSAFIERWEAWERWPHWAPRPE